MSGQERLADARKRAEQLKGQVEALKNEREEPDWDTIGVPKVDFKFEVRRQLCGHSGKVTCLQWGGSEQKLLSGSQDGNLIVWNAQTKKRMHAIILESRWVMGCAFERTNEQLVACGGLNNLCSVYNLSNPTVERATQELSGHDGYLSSAEFVNRGSEILTSSGDSTCVLWDLERGDKKQDFTEHGCDVMSVSISPTNNRMFASGSCDSTVKVWDMNSGKCIRTFEGHDSDINSVAFMSDGFVIGTASDDSSCRMFDIRSYGCLNTFEDDSMICGIATVDFSKSGRLLFAGYDEHYAVGWDTISKECTFNKMTFHENRVSCLGVNSAGNALATGSWDTRIAVWA